MSGARAVGQRRGDDKTGEDCLVRSGGYRKNMGEVRRRGGSLGDKLRLKSKGKGGQGRS